MLFSDAAAIITKSPAAGLNVLSQFLSATLEVDVHESSPDRDLPEQVCKHELALFSGGSERISPSPSHFQQVDYQKKEKDCGQGKLLS
jgi:hypothetical protein